MRLYVLCWKKLIIYRYTELFSLAQKFIAFIFQYQELFLFNRNIAYNTILLLKAKQRKRGSVGFTKVICDIIYVQITMTGLLNRNLKCILYRKSTCISYLVIFCMLYLTGTQRFFLIGLFRGVFMLCENKNHYLLKHF